MDNLKYYNDSFAYDYDMFLPKEKPRGGKVIDYPYVKESKIRKKKNARALWISNNLFKVVASIAVVALLFVYIYLNAEIDRVQSQISDVKAEITEFESEQTRLEVEISRKCSYRSLEEAAKELNMQQPEKSQMSYIRVNTADMATDASGKTLE